MSTFLLIALKKIAGYVAGRLLKPEVAVEFLLDIADNVTARTDTPGDDKVVQDLRKALGHVEEK